ncbi:MAG: hypothetical protein NT142_12460 [Planctomycetota bacterium]|nr:hypothetical protein [Planctomycetota bacterium]
MLHFLGVTIMVQLEQAGENFTAGGFADRVADTLLRLVEAVAEVGPAAGGGGYVNTSTVMPPHFFNWASFVRNNPHPCAMAAAK